MIDSPTLLRIIIKFLVYILFASHIMRQRWYWFLAKTLLFYYPWLRIGCLGYGIENTIFIRDAVRHFIIIESNVFHREQRKFIPACGNVQISLRSWSLQFIQIISKNSVPLHRNYTVFSFTVSPCILIHWILYIN